MKRIYSIHIEFEHSIFNVAESPQLAWGIHFLLQEILLPHRDNSFLNLISCMRSCSKLLKHAFMSRLHYRVVLQLVCSIGIQRKQKPSFESITHLIGAWGCVCTALLSFLCTQTTILLLINKLHKWASVDSIPVAS